MSGVLLRLARTTGGATAAEFAMVLPVALAFLLGIIDVGRLMWTWNRAEKATQMGIRYAVATDMVPSGLATYSFATGSQNGVPVVLQGNTVPATSWGGTSCTNTSCTNSGAGPTPGFNGTAFNNIVARMRAFMPEITAANVRIDYDNVGLGFSGDPNGPDVLPLIRLRLVNMPAFQPILFSLWGGTISLPDFSASLTMEDGQGSVSN